jgi:hypothetical protein
MTEVDTAVTRTTVSSSAGEFAFEDLPVGTYSITVTAAGFTIGKYDKIPVSAGTAYTLPVSQAISSSAQTIEVNASAVSLDTTSTVLTTDLPSQIVNEAPSNGRDFTQFIQYTPGFAGYSVGGGAGAAQVDGVRTNQVNWQIDGTDNNDLWWNIPAVNQGGVSGIAGVVIPLDSIEQFSFVTSGIPETSRNAGGTVNLSIKSGTNVFHGDAYYYNHNEFFAANTPFAPIGAKMSETRDIDYGGTSAAPSSRLAPGSSRRSATSERCLANSPACSTSIPKPSAPPTPKIKPRVPTTVSFPTSAMSTSSTAP